MQYENFKNQIVDQCIEKRDWPDTFLKPIHCRFEALEKENAELRERIERIESERRKELEERRFLQLRKEYGVMI